MATSNHPHHYHHHPHPNPHPHALLVTRVCESVTFAGSNHIRGRRGQPVELIARRGDVIEVCFPSPTSNQVVRMSMNSKSATIYWAEGTGALVLYIYDKHSVSGFPRISVRNEVGFRGWISVGTEATMTEDIARLLGTAKFGVNRLIAVKWNRPVSPLEQKTLRKAICHTKWQNVASVELRRRCKHMMNDAEMNFEYFFGNRAGAGAFMTDTGTPVATDAVTPAGPAVGIPVVAGNLPIGSNAPAVASRTGESNTPAVANVLVIGSACPAPLPVGPAYDSSNVAGPSGSVGASLQSFAMVEPPAPPKQPKHQVIWQPITADYLVKLQALENSVYHAITVKPRGTVRPPAVFDVGDIDPFGTASNSSKVASSTVPPQQMARQTPSTIQEESEFEEPAPRSIKTFGAPPPLPPIPAQVARLAARPREMVVLEIAQSHAEKQALTEVPSLTDIQIRRILEWRKGQARAEAEAEAEQILRSELPAGLLIDLEVDNEAPAPEGSARAECPKAEGHPEAVSQLVGLEFPGTEGDTVSEGGRRKRSSWDDLKRWNVNAVDEGSG
ncbi:hypothetical protein TWF730_009586 [Orbilia blumenaviensis]|uniref:Uncharacterized protein n=1 Tax=Orbilia blumenaviensis TaxID=1796055 RepID=A0AAV9UWC4_9PEZI